VGCVLEDNGGDLWMSTDKGVARFNPQRRTFTNYSTPDGLPGPDLTGWGACFKSQSGEMFFGGFSGATAFFPDKVQSTSYTPPIVLTDLRLFGNSVEIGGRSPLQQSLSVTRDLILSHDQNVFSLSFAALSFTNPATNRYRYRLERLEHDWNEADGDRRQATYTTLPSGMYTFRVQGAASGARRSRAGIHSRPVNLWRLGRDRGTVRDAPNKIGGLAPFLIGRQNHLGNRIFAIKAAGSYYWRVLALFMGRTKMGLHTSEMAGPYLSSAG